MNQNWLFSPEHLQEATIVFAVNGPVQLIGDNPFSLVGGCGAIWLRARRETGTVVFKATHPVLGTRAVELQIMPAEAERV